MEACGVHMEPKVNILNAYFYFISHLIGYIVLASSLKELERLKSTYYCISSCQQTAFGEIGKPGLVSPTSFGWVWRSIAWPCSQPGDGETGGVGKNCGLYVKLKKKSKDK